MTSVDSELLRKVLKGNDQGTKQFEFVLMTIFVR